MRLSEKIAQSISPLGGQTVVSLWRLYYNFVDEPQNFFSFSASTNGLDVPIVFGGINYEPIPCEIDAIEKNSLGRVNRPIIRISNRGYQMSQLLRRKNDFKNARLIRIQTFLKFIDDANFDSGENPYGVPDPTAEISRETFIVYQKRGENKAFVEFELSAPFDFSSQTTPGRVILSRYCPFQYRGKGCNYCSKPLLKKDDSAFSVAFNGEYEISSSKNLWVENVVYIAGSAVYVENQNDPPKTVFVCKTTHLSTSLNNPNQPDGAAYWEKDDCSKTIGGCKARFVNDPTNPSWLGYLKFGGYPSTDQYRLGG